MAEEKEWIELTKPLSKKPSSIETKNGQLITLPGTVTQGYQTGETVDVQLDLSDHELKRLANKEKSEKCGCGIRQGVHIVLFSVIFVPVSWIMSLCMAFYMGAITLYNIYLYYSEERTIWHKLTVCPLLILTFPFTVGLSALGVAFYACVVQVSWRYKSWLREVLDFEKGFYGWLCLKTDLPHCAPYDVVILDESVLTLQDPVS
ncbi:hypothetical protein SNE40_010816 [Patella caerulea]|uniref:Transmembrane protein 169 n=1 Tax=Patella caerulea TaxID=87958 RepID=A0AAN8JV60_PATCE